MERPYLEMVPGKIECVYNDTELSDQESFVHETSQLYFEAVK